MNDTPWTAWPEPRRSISPSCGPIAPTHQERWPLKDWNLCTRMCLVPGCRFIPVKSPITLLVWDRGNTAMPLLCMVCMQPALPAPALWLQLRARGSRVRRVRGIEVPGSRWPRTYLGRSLAHEPAHAPLSHWISFTKHIFKHKIIKSAKMTLSPEHGSSFWAQGFKD